MTDVDARFKADGSMAGELTQGGAMPRAQALLAALLPYVASDELEAQHLARMRALAEGGERCLARDHYVPGHFTASAFVLSPDRQRLLLIFHSKLRLWLQPGGHVDADDIDLASAARREAEEETGKRDLRLLLGHPVDVDVHLIPARPDAPAHEHFDVRYLFLATGDAFEASSDALAARWVALTELDTVDTDASIRRAVGKIMHWLQADAAAEDHR